MIPNLHKHKWATKKMSIFFHYTGCFIGILIMVCYNPPKNRVVESPVYPKQVGICFSVQMHTNAVSSRLQSHLMHSESHIMLGRHISLCIHMNIYSLILIPFEKYDAHVFARASSTSTSCPTQSLQKITGLPSLSCKNKRSTQIYAI